jgi:hypothetical protein
MLGIQRKRTSAMTSVTEARHRFLRGIVLIESSVEITAPGTIIGGLPYLGINRRASGHHSFYFDKTVQVFVPGKRVRKVGKTMIWIPQVAN